VIRDALAAVAPLVAGSIGTGAVFDSFGGNAFHWVDAPFVLNFKKVTAIASVIKYIKRRGEASALSASPSL
jgi:hypothetical protein